jgi:hypothetical protein
MQGGEADGGASGPEPGPGGNRAESPLRPAASPLRRPQRGIPGGVLVGWLAWVRAQPVLAAALLGFCVIAVGGLILSLPRGTPPAGGQRGGRVSASAPAARGPIVSPETPTSRVPDGPAGEAPAVEPGPWVEVAPSPPSARGLALVYRHRTLPPGGESRFEWIVQVRGARSVLDSVDAVKWGMDPAPKNEGELISRGRAADGFPLFGDGPGGWFGVFATVQYRDGGEETLSRQIELPD